MLVNIYDLTLTDDKVMINKCPSEQNPTLPAKTLKVNRKIETHVVNTVFPTDFLVKTGSDLCQLLSIKIAQR